MAHALKIPLSATELAVQRRRAAIKRTRGVLATLTHKRSLVDEVIAERRVEAQAEDHDDAAEAARRRRRVQT